MGGLVVILVWIVLLCLIAYLIFWALAKIPLPEPVRVIVTVLVVLVILLFIVQRFSLLSGLMPPPPLILVAWLLWPAGF